MDSVDQFLYVYGDAVGVCEARQRECGTDLGTRYTRDGIPEYPVDHDVEKGRQHMVPLVCRPRLQY